MGSLFSRTLSQSATTKTAEPAPVEVTTTTATQEAPGEAGQESFTAPVEEAAPAATTDVAGEVGQESLGAEAAAADTATAEVEPQGEAAQESLAAAPVEATATSEAEPSGEAGTESLAAEQTAEAGAAQEGDTEADTMQQTEGAVAEAAAAPTAEVVATPTAEAPATAEAKAEGEGGAEMQEAATQQTAAVEGEAAPTGSLDTSGNITLGQLSVGGKLLRHTRSKPQLALARIEQTHRHDRRVGALRRQLGHLSMITQFSQVARDYNLSAPMVAAFKSTPGFDEAVRAFPNAELFNIVAEHHSDVNNVAGLESFDAATAENADVVADRAREVVEAFKAVLSGMDAVLDNLSVQVSEDKEALEESDITDEVLSTLPVHTLSHTSFTELFSKLEEHLKSMENFDVEELRAHPEKIKDEIEALIALVDDLGQVIGLSIGEYGLSEDDRGEAFEPTPGSFEEKELTKTGLMFHLDKAAAVLDALKALAARKDSVAEALDAALADMPEALASDDVTYGRVEHVTLLCCYTTLIAKLIRESIVSVTMILSTVDAALDIDDGQVEEAA